MSQEEPSADLSEIVVRLEARLLETRMALLGAMKTIAILVQESPLSQEAYDNAKDAALDALSDLHIRGGLI